MMRKRTAKQTRKSVYPLFIDVNKRDIYLFRAVANGYPVERAEVGGRFYRGGGIDRRLIADAPPSRHKKFFGVLYTVRDVDRRTGRAH